MAKKKWRGATFGRQPRTQSHTLSQTSNHTQKDTLRWRRINDCLRASLACRGVVNFFFFLSSFRTLTCIETPRNWPFSVARDRSMTIHSFVCTLESPPQPYILTLMKVSILLVAAAAILLACQPTLALRRIPLQKRHPVDVRNTAHSTTQTCNTHTHITHIELDVACDATYHPLHLRDVYVGVLTNLRVNDWNSISC